MSPKKMWLITREALSPFIHNKRYKPPLSISEPHLIGNNQLTVGVSVSDAPRPLAT